MTPTVTDIDRADAARRLGTALCHPAGAVCADALAPAIDCMAEALWL